MVKELTLDEITHRLAVGIAIVDLHTLANTNPLTPGPNTLAMARGIIKGLTTPPAFTKWEQVDDEG